MVDNGKTQLAEQEKTISLFDSEGAKQIASELRNELRGQPQAGDLSKYLTMEGMQSEDKVDFFTQFVNTDDVLRMNTIQMFVKLAPMIVKTTSKANRIRINQLLNDVYGEHVYTHKVNMTSLNRLREKAYVDILRNDGGGDVAPNFANRLFGVKGGKK